MTRSTIFWIAKRFRAIWKRAPSKSLRWPSCAEERSNDAFIILDEAQNTTSEQMKMFLTRIGMRSKAVITGDVTQIDLPFGRSSGLIEAKSILGDIAGLAFCYFNENDVVRHHLVRLIIKAYQRHAENETGSEGNGRNGKGPKD